MVSERTTPLRERMIEDMRIRGLGHQSQRAHIRGVKDFASYLGHSPDTATREELRAYQLLITAIECSRGRKRKGPVAMTGPLCQWTDVPVIPVGP